MPARISGVYIIKNIITNKIYVGSSYNYSKRISQHKLELNKNKHHNAYLQRAWNKYGKNAFIFDYIEKCDEELLIEREQYWMDFYKSYLSEHGYNINPTAGSCLGCKRSDETKKRISSSKKGHIVSDETKHKISKTMKIKQNGVSNSFFGKHHTDVTKKKISESNKGKQCGENNPMKNSINVEKMKEAMMSVSYKWSGDNNPAKRPDVRNKIRIAAIGRKRVMNDDGTWHWSRGD